MPGLFVFLAEIIVELIAMAVTFANNFVAIDSTHAATLAKAAFVTAQTHRATHVGNVLLVLHDVDDVVRSLRIHFDRVGILVAQYVSVPEFDNHHLHTQADTEGRQVVFAAVLCSNDFAFDTTLAKIPGKSRSHPCP